DECSDGNAGAIPLGFIHDQAEILAHPVDGETKIEFPVDHGAATVFHLPALCRTFVDDVEDLFHVQASCLTKCDAFGQSLDQTSDADLVDHFAQLTGTGRPQQRDRLSEIQ